MPVKKSKTPLAMLGAGLLIAGGIALGIAFSGPKAPPTTVGPTAVVTPPVPAPVDLSILHFGPEERPQNYRWLPVKAPARNPYPVKSEAEIDELVRYLDGLGLQNVSRADLQQGYVAHWFNVSLLALESSIAERLEKDFQGLAHLKNRWSRRDGNRLVLVYAGRREYRFLLEDIVRRTQKKLGLPEQAPDLPVENLKVDPSHLPKEWSILQQTPLLQVFAAPKGEGSLTLQVWELPTPAEADAQEKRLRAAPPKGIRSEVLRAARVVALVSHDTQHVGGAEKIFQELRTWTGRPAKTFDTLLPNAAELPPGWSFDKILTDPKAVLDELGLGEIKPADVKHAFHATLKPHGSIQLFEIPESKLRYSAENQLKKIGPAEDTDEFLFAVQAPDDPSLDALENRLREKFGFDRNRPRYIKMADARLVEKDLPPGLTLKPLKAEDRTYEAELSGGLKVVVRDFHDYGLLEEYAYKEAPYSPGDILLVKDFIVVHLAGPESAWTVLDALEAVLRQKMRMGAAELDDLLYGAGLPRGSTLKEPAQLKDFAAKQRLDGAALKSAWRMDSETIAGILLEAKDAQGAEILQKALPGSWKKGVFVASVKALDGAVPEDVKKASAALRGRLRAK